ncbi:hypothetical protein MesoLj131a_57850 [Mesorhizobium sp. 131-2-1]|nr:hypothetical protein MesoLj131a_57850 [Mesorhizobium sp. 131-2-1]
MLNAKSIPAVTPPDVNIAISHDASLLVTGADQGQQVDIGPMRGGPTSLQQSGRTKKKSAHANRGHILCAPTLTPNELDSLDVCEGLYDARTTGYANQVERRTVLESTGRQDAEAAIAHNWEDGFCDNVDFGFGKFAGRRERRRRSQPAQDFKWASEVELCDSREDHEADVEFSHARPPLRS